MLSISIRTLQPFILGIAFVLLYFGEQIAPEQPSGRNKRHDLINVAIGVGNGVFNFTVGYFFQMALQWFNQLPFGLFNYVALPFWLSMLLQLLLLDLYMYWWHRFNHTSPFLWRFHRFHHLDEAMNTTTALRFHTVELTFSYIARLLVFPLFGFSVGAIILYSLVFFPVVLLHHSNLRISRAADLILRKLIVSPGMHRIHHSRKQIETNSNYSSVLPLWDRLFRSYRSAPEGPVSFGVD